MWKKNGGGFTDFWNRFSHFGRLRIWMFPKIGVPPIIHVFLNFPLFSPSILGVFPRNFWKHPSCFNMGLGWLQPKPPKLGSWVLVHSHRTVHPSVRLRWISPSCYAALDVLALRRWSWTSVPLQGWIFGKFSPSLPKIFCRAPLKTVGLNVLVVFFVRGWNTTQVFLGRDFQHKPWKFHKDPVMKQPGFQFESKGPARASTCSNNFPVRWVVIFL